MKTAHSCGFFMPEGQTISLFISGNENSLKDNATGAGLFKFKT